MGELVCWSGRNYTRLVSMCLDRIRQVWIGLLVMKEPFSLEIWIG
jgi:hypothetical protein